MPRFFVKIGLNKSGMSLEFCLFVIGGKEMLLFTQQEVHFQNGDYYQRKLLKSCRDLEFMLVS